MTAVFRQALLLSLWGGAAALGISLVCPLLRRGGAPAGLLRLLWLVPAVRFLCPFGLAVALPRPKNPGLAAAADAVTRYTAPAATGIPPAAEITGQAAVPASLPTGAPLPGSVAGAISTAAPDPWAAALWLLALVWLVGIVLLAVRGLAAWWRLRHALALSCKEPDGTYTCAAVQAPFTLGVFRPHIYLPATLQGPERAAVLLHEQTHIHQGDPLLKPLYYSVACLHWWNPLAWLAFRQFTREMEAACDEAALRRAGMAGRTGYCESLYRFATGDAVAKVPGALAFGDGQLKGRILRILHYKKPTAGAVVFCGVAAALTFAACMAKPTVAPGTEASAAPTVTPTAAPAAVSTALPATAATVENAVPKAEAAQNQGELQTALQETSTNVLAELQALNARFEAGDDDPSADKLSESRAALAAKLLDAAAPGTVFSADRFVVPLSSYDYISHRMADGHLGDDLAAARGEPVYAAAAGLVEAAGYHHSYGNYVMLYHGTDADGKPWQTMYAHLDSVSVQTGDLLSAGQQVGAVGNTGNSTGTHLHLELWVGKNRLDPIIYIPLP